MEKIHKFVECLLPVTSCNLHCSYCYVIQENRRKMEIPKLDYSTETMIKAMSKERFGGTCLFSICGAGETLIPDYTIEIIHGLLKNGHFVNVTTNGTLTKRFDDILENFSNDEKQRLHFAFSLHYIELKRLNLLDTFFNNVKNVHKAGCSFLVQLNMCDEYMPYIDEIKDLCQTHIGAFPQIAVTRKEVSYPKTEITLATNGSKETYLEAGRKFHSPLFEFTYKNFLTKRKEFCYAGDWAYTLNLKTGLLKRCYCSCIVQNIFKNSEKPIFELAVGKHCNSLYCTNSSHFMSLGVIPELHTPTYAELRNREEANWYQETMKTFLSGKLSNQKKKYSIRKKVLVFLAGIYDKAAYKAYVQLLSSKTKKSIKNSGESK